MLRAFILFVTPALTGWSQALPAYTPYPVVANIDFAEGPAFDSKGALYFVNYLRNGTIGKMSTDGRVEVWVDLKDGQANGLKVDDRDNVIAADYKGKRLLRISPKGKVKVLADRFEGQPFKGINDVCLDRAGNIYFTDPTGSGKNSPVGAFYRYSKEGKLDRLATGFAFPNGIAVSPDQKRLYVSESENLRVLAFDLSPEGSVSNQRVLHQFNDGGLDGMMFDDQGRLWVTRWNGKSVDVLSESGQLLGSIPAGGDQVTNIAFWRGVPYLTVAGEHSIHRLDLQKPK